MALVVGRSPLIGDRGALLGGEVAGQLDGRLVGGATPYRGLGRRGTEVRRVDRGEADAHLRDRVAVEPDRDAGGGDRPVADPALDLLVGAAATGPNGDAD